MEELPVEDPAHMASADRQLHDWEDYIMGKRLTDETSGEDMISKEQLPKGTKVIHESEEIDMSYTPDRITVVIGDDDMIRQVYRG